MTEDTPGEKSTGEQNLTIQGDTELKACDRKETKTGSNRTQD